MHILRATALLFVNKMGFVESRVKMVPSSSDIFSKHSFAHTI